MNPNRPTPKHAIIQMTKVKDNREYSKDRKRKRKCHLNRILIRLSADFSAETLHDIFKVLKRKNLQPRIFYPARLSFRREGERERISQKSQN